MPDHALVSALALVGLFTGICLFSFKRLATRSPLAAGVSLDLKLDRTLSRLSILALLLFAADLYILKFKLLFAGFRPFEIFPTFEALLFLLMFVGYLVIVWAAAWSVQKRFFPRSVTRKSFVLSNISFSLPALLPWFLLSITADLIQILPFDGPRTFLATPGGEILYVLFFLFAVASVGPVMIQKLWGCSPLDKGPVRDRIESLCNTAQLGYADILKWELFGGSMITAGVMGLVARFRYILVTPALVTLLTPPEIDAVIAHEIGHVKHRHIHFYLVFFAGYIACVYALFDPLYVLVYYLNPLSAMGSFVGMAPESVSTLVFSLVLILLFLLYFRFGFGFFMRNFERQADTHVYSLLGNAGSLINTFYKIARFSRTSPDRPNWHHFSITQRIGFLEQCEADSTLVGKHNKKIRRMILGYLVAILLVVIAGYSLNFGKGKEALNRYLAETVLLRELEIDPENADLYTMIGDYYYEREMFEQAIQAYDNVLKIAPRNVHALNNLAWLFATCRDASFQDPEKALNLSTTALGVDRAAYVLDTHAEACQLNGLDQAALAAAMEALAMAGDRVGYYQSQVDRFQKRIRDQQPPP
ncbi:MAG: M48 family metalloprotease [Desulfobacterium sp.]|nr:M48 family metalloprotease [Desulfobacterium sp.]